MTQHRHMQLFVHPSTSCCNALNRWGTIGPLLVVRLPSTLEPDDSIEPTIWNFSPIMYLILTFIRNCMYIMYPFTSDVSAKCNMLWLTLQQACYQAKLMHKACYWHAWGATKKPLGMMTILCGLLLQYCFRRLVVYGQACQLQQSFWYMFQRIERIEHYKQFGSKETTFDFF